jgi:syndecan 1
VTRNPRPEGRVVQRDAQQAGPIPSDPAPQPRPQPARRAAEAVTQTESRPATQDAGVQTEPEGIDIEALISGFTRRHLDTLARRLHGPLQRLSRDDLRHSRERSGQWRDGRR